MTWRGDFASAAADTALAVLPIAGGWMDDLGGLRHAPDDPPGGGVSGGWLGDDEIRAVSGLVPGSPEHMAQRWSEYQSNPDNAGWTYERWRTNYVLNQTRALDAQREVEAYAQTLGWGSTSQINLNLPELGGRRLDIIDIDLRQGIEYKSGNYFYRDPDIMAELAKDKALVDSGWTIEWVFQVSDSVCQPLIDELIDAGITVRVNGEIASHSTRLG